MRKRKDKYGKYLVNYGSLDFLSSEYKEHHYGKKYDFSKYNIGVLQEKSAPKKEKFNPADINWGDSGVDVYPIRTDTTDASYFINSDTGITFNFKKKKDDTQ